MKHLKKGLLPAVLLAPLLIFIFILTSCCFNLDLTLPTSASNGQSSLPDQTQPNQTETAETTLEESSVLETPDLKIISKLKIPGQAIDVKSLGGYAYLTNDLGILFVIDVHDKENPQIIGKCTGIDSANIVMIQDSYAYISYTSWVTPETSTETQDTSLQDGMVDFFSICGFKIVDIKDKRNPKVVGDFISGQGEEKSVQGLIVDGDYAYLNSTKYLDASQTSRLEVIDIKDKTDPRLLSYCEIEGTPNGLFVQGDYAYINNTYYDYQKKEYKSKSKLFVVNIQDKSKPFVEGSCEVPANSWSILVRGENAYLSSSIYDEAIDDYKDSVLQIINISDPRNPVAAGKCDIPGGAWELDIKDDFLFVSNNEGGVAAINISDSTNPAIAAMLSTGGNTYDVAISGDYGYLADGFEGLAIINIQKKEPGQGMVIEEGTGSNKPPVANIDIFGDKLDSGSFIEDNPVYFSAISSYDPEGKDISYSWEINGNPVYDVNDTMIQGDQTQSSGLSSVISEKKDEIYCVFENPGDYMISLVVSDGMLISEKKIDIKIENQEISIVPLKEHSFKVQIECLLKNNSNITLKDLECYLRTPQTYYPFQTVKKVDANIKTVDEVFDDSWNLLTHFKFDKNISVAPGKEFSAIITSSVIMYEYSFKNIRSNGMGYQPGDEDLKNYTQEDIFIDIDSPVITDALKKAIGNQTDPVIKARRIYDYVADNIYYDFQRAADRKYKFMSASEILKTGKGVCADYAILYVALLRAAGIPSRVVGGIPVTLTLKEKNSEIDIGHAWVELKLPGYGWVPMNITQEDGFMRTDFYMNLGTEKGTSFLYESQTMDWSSYYYDGFKYRWDGNQTPEVDQKLIYRIKGIDL